jgi:hypothetical protein
MGRVIFFPLKFIQSEEKLKELLKAQEVLYYARISFLNAVNRESPYQQVIAHTRLRNIIKDRLRVISGETVEAERIEDF